MPKKKPWDLKWKIIKTIGGGGQGSTHKVISRQDNKTLGCLKILTDNDSSERRERFRRECVILETLNHTNIPRFLDDNSAQFQTREKLYLVTEYIEGDTLAKTVNKKNLSPTDAILLVTNLLSTLEFVHSREIVHRDIKPDNIILRKNDMNDLVIVDFGLSFNREASSLSTATIQQLGNRFLHLPELQVESGDKRNPISDITQTVGILLFAISGYPPVTLLDDQGQYPHQRSTIRENLLKVQPELASYLFSVFDRAFNPSLQDRWQSARQLRDYLEKLIIPKDSQTTNSTMDFVANLINSPEYQKRNIAREAFEEFRGYLELTFKEILADFEGEPLTYGTNNSDEMSRLRFTVNFYLYFKNFDESRTQVAISCSLIGNEIIVQSEVDNKGQHVEVGRVSLKPPRNWSTMSATLRSEVFRVVYEVIRPKLSAS